MNSTERGKSSQIKVEHAVRNASENVIGLAHRWLRGFVRQLRRLRDLGRAPVVLIDDALWRRATAPYVFVERLTAEENRRLRLIASEFLSRKKFFGAGGFEVTEFIRVQIAAQACILILELGTGGYEGWNDIVIYPATFRTRREFTDSAGVVHTITAALAGEAWLGGPVVLAYDAITKADGMHAHNVVIHEFAHKLDMQNGPANGFPPLHRGMKKSAWNRAFMAGYLDFCARADQAKADAYRDGGAGLQGLPLDAYAGENPAEFFAVISEAFFEAPHAVKTAFPAVYQQLVLFYRHDNTLK